jgi:predicted dehydrogenase
VTIQIGIIGAGNISRTHARAALDIPGVKVVAYWSRSPERAGAMAAEFGGRAFTTLDELVAHRPMDFVIVGTPSGLHCEQAIAAVRRGLHVLVEKPLDVTTQRVDQLLEECDRNKVTIGVIFQDRTAPHLAWLRERIAAGDLGRLLEVSAELRWYRPPEYYAASSWRGTWAFDGGGALMNQGAHTVDLLLWLAGDVDRVSATTRTALHAIEVEDTAVACLEYGNGAVGTLEVTTAAYPGFPRRLTVTGSEGTIVVEGDHVATIALRRSLPPPPSQDVNTNPNTSSPIVSDVTGHRRVIADFISALQSGRAPLCDGRDGRRSVALIEAAYESARIGAPVRVGAAENRGQTRASANVRV